MSIAFIEIITYILILLAFLHFRKYNDEFLFLPVMFFWTTGLQRLNAVTSGKAEWVSVNYTYNIFTPITIDKATTALFYFFLGTATLFFSYRFYNNKTPSSSVKKDNQELFILFINTKRSFILGFFTFFLIVNTIFLGMLRGPLALGNSYFYLFGMAVASFVLLGYLVYKSTPPGNGSSKKLYAIMIAYAMWLSYSPSKRFQFLSWMIALGIIMLQKYTPMQKTKYYAIGGIGVLLFFSLAGVARKHNLSNLSLNEMYELATERSESREDQNMLDGFMMLMDVYPNHLDYAYGMEHFEILLRPIPRKLWPGKPKGSYINKLGLSDARKSTVGISPTLYGSFYAEAGVFGILLFSVIYGWLMVKLFRYTDSYDSDMRWLLKGIIFASFIPLLRGGDLPGIVAFIGMSYWPVFVFLYQYNKFITEVKLDEDHYTE